jgi:hypothetical protein
MSALGLRSIEIINSKPRTLGGSIETINDRFSHLTSLGLNAAAVINAAPSTLELTAETIQNKVDFLKRTCRLLQWQYTAEGLIDAYPALLTFSVKKLQILRRIAAQHVDISDRQTSPKRIKSSLITPLEQYLLTLPDNQNVPQTIASWRKMAQMAQCQYRLPAAERKQQAASLAQTGQLGRVGVMYLNYRNLS